MNNDYDVLNDTIIINVKNFIEREEIDLFTLTSKFLCENMITLLDFKNTNINDFNDKFFESFCNYLYSKLLETSFLNDKLRLINLDYKMNSLYIKYKKNTLDKYQPWETNISLYSIIYGKKK